MSDDSLIGMREFCAECKGWHEIVDDFTDERYENGGRAVEYHVLVLDCGHQPSRATGTVRAAP